ncbi:hypothetical protein ACHAXN_013289 [Cyclotella atomus]
MFRLALSSLLVGARGRGEGLRSIVDRYDRLNLSALPMSVSISERIHTSIAPLLPPEIEEKQAPIAFWYQSLHCSICLPKTQHHYLCDAMRRVLQHVVIFKLNATFTDELTASAITQLEAVVKANEGIIAASFGANETSLYDTYKPHTGGFTHTLIVTFVDERALKFYDTEAEHIKLGGIVIPHMKEAVATDTWIDTYPD